MHKARQQRAALMEAARKQQTDKDKRTMAFNPVSSAKTDPIYYSSSRMDGVGLWVQPTAKLESRALPPTVPVHASLTSEIDVKVAKDLVKVLERKCSDLAQELDKETILRKTLENRLFLLEDRVLAEAKGKQHLSEQLTGHRTQLEREMDEFTIYRNYAETTICDLQKEIENERERAETQQKLLQQETCSKEEELSEYEQELAALTQQLEEITAQNTAMLDFIANLQAENEILQQENGGLTKEPYAEQKQKSNPLLTENKTLQQKTRALEEERGKTLALLTRKENELKTLKAEQKRHAQTEQELRKHQLVLTAQRDSKLALVESKYKALHEQFQLLVHKAGPKAKSFQVAAEPGLFDN